MNANAADREDAGPGLDALVLALAVTISAIGITLPASSQEVAPVGAATRASSQDTPTAGDDLPAIELSPQHAVELALRHNLQVRVNAFNHDLAVESINSARARFDPLLRFDLPQSFSRSTAPQTSQISGAEVLTSENLSTGFSLNNSLRWGTQWSLGWSTRRSSSNNEFSTFNPSFSSNMSINVSQPLLEGYGEKVNTRSIVVAQNDLSVTREQFREQVQSVVFQTYQAYWQLVFRVRDLGVKQLALDLARQQLDRNLLQAEIGAIAAIETVQAERAVASAEVSLIAAEIARNNAEDDLKQLINVDAFSETGWYVQIVPTADPETEIAPVNVVAALAVALENDPQLRQERINLATRGLDLDVARNALLPQLDLQASLTLQGRGGNEIVRSGGLGGEVIDIIEGGFTDAMGQVFSGDFPNWSVGLSVTLPIGNTAAEAQHAQASIRERQTLARIADREQAVRVSILRLARNLENGNQGVVAARKARELTARQLEAEQRKFDVGSTTNFQVLEFQRQLAEAQTQEIQAIIDLNVARAQFEQAKGTLLEDLGVSIDQAGGGRGTPLAATAPAS